MAVTKISVALPDLLLAPGSTLTVTLDDAAAVLTQLNVYGYTPSRENVGDLPTVPPLFAYAESA